MRFRVLGVIFLTLLFACNDDQENNNQERPGDPGIEAVKTVDIINDIAPVGPSLGDTLEYTVTIENVGNVSLNNVEIIDVFEDLNGDPLKLGIEPTFINSNAGSPEGSLEVGEIATYTLDYIIEEEAIMTGGFNNSILASGESPEGTIVEDISDDGDDTDGNIEDDKTEVQVVFLDGDFQIIQTIVDQEYNSGGLIDVDYSKAIHFDSNNNIMGWFVTFLNGYNTISFNGTDGLVTDFSIYDVYFGDSIFTEYEFLYDSSGNMIQINRVFWQEGGSFEQTFYLNYQGDTTSILDSNSNSIVEIIKDVNGKIMSISNSEHTYDFEYQDGNLISITGEDDSMLTFEYDNFRNPYSHEQFMNMGEITNYIPMLPNWTGNPTDRFRRTFNIYQNENNVINISVNNSCSFPNCMKEAAYTYYYNTYGYPITKNRIYPENVVYSMQYIYGD